MSLKRDEMSVSELSLIDSLKRSGEALDRELGASDDIGLDPGPEALRRADALRRALKAAELLDQLRTGATQPFFDPATEQGDRKLASRLKAELK
jgi:hypothetical protein